MSITDALAAKLSVGEHGQCLSGKYVQVHLGEPLGGRQLFDGAYSPPHARSPDDVPYSVSV